MTDNEEYIDLGEVIDLGDVRPQFSMREYQALCLAAIDSAWLTHGRVLIVIGTGGGKTVIFSQVTLKEVSAGGRVLIIAHSEELLDQAADKLERSTGLKAEREKAQERASLEASVVIASVQTLSRDARLMGFPHDHFSLVVVDETHRALAVSYQKILCYFHFGDASLQPGWEMPAPGVAYRHFARVLGVTATADRGDGRNLGEFFQKCAFEYGLLQLCRDGYLVRPLAVQVPLQIDLRKVRTSRSANGSDFDAMELAERINPFLKEIARNIVEYAGERKTVCFLPSIETARLLSIALAELGLNASFVSGACVDREEKIEAFAQAGPGSIICNAMLLTEGWDCADVSAVCVLRPTKIRSLYVQMVGRGTRTLPGTIDGLTTREERLAAIARSAKPDLKILDFLWLSDRLDLIQPIDIVAQSPQARKAMKDNSAETGAEPTDLLALAEAADRDLLESLERAAKEHSGKKARVIDPLAFAATVGDASLSSYTPQTADEARPPAPGMLKVLRESGIDTQNIPYNGLAGKILDHVIARQTAGLCDPKQMSFLRDLGVINAARLTRDQATRAIRNSKLKGGIK